MRGTSHSALGSGSRSSYPSYILAPRDPAAKKRSERDPYSSYKEGTRRETEAQDCHSRTSEVLTAPSPPQSLAQGGWMDMGPGDGGLTETGSPSLAGQG